METCKFCSDKEREYLIDTRSDSWGKDAFLKPGMEVWIDDDNTLSINAVANTYEPNFSSECIEINFCPICGRNLKED